MWHSCKLYTSCLSVTQQNINIKDIGDVRTDIPNIFYIAQSLVTQQE